MPSILMTKKLSIVSERMAWNKGIWVGENFVDTSLSRVFL